MMTILKNSHPLLTFLPHGLKKNKIGAMDAHTNTQEN
jgi:hypothetical protein